MTGLRERIDRTLHHKQPRNPLAAGTYCEDCGQRLDRDDRPCPMCEVAR